eukprot:4816573-Pyramimonas_sp.AAC.1
MARPLLLGLSLLRYNRAGARLRLRRSCWLGLPTPFKLGSGAGHCSQLLLCSPPSTALFCGLHT